MFKIFTIFKNRRVLVGHVFLWIYQRFCLGDNVRAYFKVLLLKVSLIAGTRLKNTTNIPIHENFNQFVTRVLVVKLKGLKCNT